MYYGNLPDGVTQRSMDEQLEHMSVEEQTRTWFHDNREVPDDDPTHHYVKGRIMDDDAPGADEVLKWIEKQVIAGNLDPIDDIAHEPRDRY